MRQSSLFAEVGDGRGELRAQQPLVPHLGAVGQLRNLRNSAQSPCAHPALPWTAHSVLCPSVLVPKSPEPSVGLGCRTGLSAVGWE